MQFTFPRRTQECLNIPRKSVDVLLVPKKVLLGRRREQTCCSLSRPRWKPFEFLRCDWLSRTTLDADWLYFSHVKTAIREADWTFSTCEI